MADIEDRVNALEDARRILNGIALEQLGRLRDLEHNVTILVGVQGSQGRDIAAILTGLDAIDTRLDAMVGQLATIIGLLRPDKP
jgi:hypothetical protein